MVKKIAVEVFKDNNYPELDSDDIAHALATINVIKPFVEIINRNRKLQLGPSQGALELDVSKQVRVALQSDAGVFYTGRHIVNADGDQDDDSRTTGIYLGRSDLCVVSTHSSNVVRTSRHELGHYLHQRGRVLGRSVDAETDHCPKPDCAMHETIISEKRRVIPGMGRRAAEALGLQTKQYEYVVNSLEYCADCEDSMGKSAYVIALLKQNYLPLAETLIRNFTQE